MFRANVSCKGVYTKQICKLSISKDALSVVDYDSAMYLVSRTKINK